jgi:predicted ATPase/serine/threonine protein kinase
MGGDAARVSADGGLERLSLGTPDHPVRLGRYDVVGRLGSGGMGTVYEAIDRERGTRVALKTLSAFDVSMGVYLKREFRAVADLAHPNLAAVYELGCEDGLWFFAMERVEGVHFTSWARGGESFGKTVRTPSVQVSEMRDRTVDLHGMTTRELVIFDEPEPPSEEREACAPARSIEAVRRAFAELVRGLCALHGAGLWHGDIKPANVLVREDGRVVVVDFGLARPVEGARATQGPMPGTPLFMSPEQLAGEHAGPASDWHAVGSMLYEVLTGWPPFRGGSLLDLYFKKSHEIPPSPRELVPEIPEELSDLCMALLRAEPELRPTGVELLRILAGEETSSSDPTLRTFFVGRQQELSELERAYRRARAGQRTFAHVHGASGIGKTTIVRRFLRGVHSVERARVLRGRCYERESVPYKAFDGIIDDLAELLRERHVEHIEALLPEWVAELARVFPSLLAVPGVHARAQRATVAHEARELRRRAWTALAQLFAALGRERPVVLSIDDLQWADADSVLLLESLIRNAADARLLIVASYRPEEAARNPELARHFEAWRVLDGGRGFVSVPISGLARPEAEKLARAALQSLNAPVSEARVRSLAEEARGVPFFVEELARFVAGRARDEELHDVSLERAIAARLRALPTEQRAIIEVVAVADTPVPQSLVFEAAGLDAGALPALLALRSASMLGWTGASGDDLVSTYHDRIRESVLATMDERARAKRHLSLGRALRARHDRDEPGAWVFATVRHLGAAAALLTDARERRDTANLLLQAGRLARSAAAFPLAFRCFEGGIALIEDDAWATDYDLALGLFCGAAESAYLTAEWPILDARVATVKARGRTVMDQLVAWELAIDAQVGRHEYVGAIATACEVLALLGFELVSDPDKAVVEGAFHRALSSLERVGPKGLAALADVDDAKTAAAMRIHIRVSPAAYFGRPMLLPVIAANLIVTSIERGLSPATPYALALFGIVLNTVGLYPQAHAWGQLAVQLLDRWEDKSLEAATRHVVFNLVCTWMAPLHTILAPLREVFDIGRRTGDFEYGSYAAHGYVHHAMYASRPLEPLLEEALDLGEQMRALGQVNAVHVHEPFEQLLKCLTGKIEDPARLNDATFDEQALLARAEVEGSRSGIYVTRLVMGLARYWFGELAEANACFDIARAYSDAGPSVWHGPIMHQFGALAACAAWESTPESERPAARAKIEASLLALRILAGHAPVNFAHRVCLLEGELARIDGRSEEALAKFADAIALAGDARFDNDIALAHELSARCHRDPARARASLSAARDGYAKWGARAKAKQLDARISDL